MARKFLKKPGAYASAAVANDGNQLWSAGIFKIIQGNKIDLNNKMGNFLLNPSSWEEHKATNWVGHEIPGQSDPVMQWTSGGPRIVTFEALVTKDHSGFDLVQDQSSLGAAIDDAINVVGNIASNFLGVSLPAIGDLLPIGDQGAGEELSIHNQLNYYRSLMYPKTTEDKQKLVSSPPLVCLMVGKTLSKNTTAPEVGLDTDLWVVTDLRIRVTKQLPNLAPMEAYVSFQLTEYVRRSKSSSDFAASPDDGPAGFSSPGEALANAITSLF